VEEQEDCLATLGQKGIKGGELKRVELRSHHHGQFGDYAVQGFRYQDEDGEIVWHSISHSEKSPIHSYWVVSEEFYAVSRHYSHNSPDEMQIALEGRISNVDPDEKKAILGAIATWESYET
jgi:hypothetical protein